MDPHNEVASHLLEQFKNNFNFSGIFRIPAFHPQKVLKNSPGLTLEAEKLIKEKKQLLQIQNEKKAKSVNMNEIIESDKQTEEPPQKQSTLPKKINKPKILIGDDNFCQDSIVKGYIDDITGNNEEDDQKNNTDKNKKKKLPTKKVDSKCKNNITLLNPYKSPNKTIKPPENFKELAEKMPSYLVQELFKDYPKKVSVIKQKVTISDPQSGFIKEKMTTPEDNDLENFKNNIILLPEDSMAEFVYSSRQSSASPQNDNNMENTE